MAITGRLNADFQSFFEACRQAEVSLQGFDKATHTVEQSLNSMTTALPASTIKTQASTAAAAVASIAPPAVAARRELEALDKWAQGGAASFKTLGKEMGESGGVAGKAAEGLTGAAQALGMIDGVLKPLGVNLGPARAALADLGAAATVTGGALGTLGPIILLVGTALASVKTGRFLADLAGTDKIVGDLAAKLLGLKGGVLGFVEAAVGAETLAKASEHAGYAITDMNEAIRINEEWAKGAIAANLEYAKAAERGVASEKNAKAIADFHAELEKFRASGFLDDLTRDLKSNVFTVEQLHDAYKISTAAVQQFAKESQDAARIEESNAKKLADIRDQLTKRIGEQEEEKRIALEKATAAMYAQIDASWKAVEAAKARADAEAAAAQATAEANKQSAEAARIAANAKTDADRATAWSTVAGSIDLSSVAGASTFFNRPQKSLEDFVRLYDNPQFNAPLEWIGKQFEQYQQARETARRTLAENDPTNPAYMTQAERDKVAAAKHSWWSTEGGAAAAPPVTINVSGLLDARTIDELSTKVSGVILRRTGSKVPATG